MNGPEATLINNCRQMVRDFGDLLGGRLARYQTEEEKP